jgi:homocitrate synthase NifV
MDDGVNAMKILDTTLREGLQRSGAYLEPRARRVLADELVASGIDELEIGVVGRDGFVPSLLSGLLTRHPRAKFWVWSRLRTADVEEASRMGARSIALCVPVSPEHLQDRLGWSRAELHDRIRLIVGFAVEMGLEVSVGLEDASRTPEDAMLEAARAAVEAGATRIRMADTVGVFSPAETAQRTLSLRSLGCQVGFHGHDDFGMATANALAALEAGAHAADASLMGWGERAGIASTECLGAFLSLRRGGSLDVGRLSKAARDLAGRCGVRIPETAPVIGDALFRCETGLHVAALAEHPSLYEPYEPELVGAKRDLLVGGKSGAQAVRKILSKIDPDAVAEPGLVVRIRRAAERLGRPLESRELARLASSTPR